MTFYFICLNVHINSFTFCPALNLILQKVYAPLLLNVLQVISSVTVPYIIIWCDEREPFPEIVGFRLILFQWCHCQQRYLDTGMSKVLEWKSILDRQKICHIASNLLNIEHSSMPITLKSESRWYQFSC